MADRIIEVNAIDQYNDDMIRYSIYSLYSRYVPNINDGLKPVQRRILTAAYFDIKCTSNLVKSAKIVGAVIGDYHGHGDTAVYESMKPMSNWYETMTPILTSGGNWGSFQGDDPAAMRYTESRLSEFGVECVLGDLTESETVVDWYPTFTDKFEPSDMACRIPLLLHNGCFSIAIGMKIEIPHHSLNDVIDATLMLIDNPNAKVILIPDHCMECEIVDTDWEKISEQGYGSYTVRGIIETHYAAREKTESRKDELVIRTQPDLVFAGSIVSKINTLIAEKKIIQIDEIIDSSDDNNMRIRIILKPGTDPEFVRQMIYKFTPIQDTKRVNMEVINNFDIRRYGYKEYLLNFIDYRKKILFRLYNYRLQKAETKMHEKDTYIKILESGQVDEIIRAIRKRDQTGDAELISWLVKKLDITDLQAKFIINSQLKALSKGALANYQKERNELKILVDHAILALTHEELIVQEIKDDLIYLRRKYGKPRKSILVTEASASNIPAGTFRIVVTQNNFFKKLPADTPVREIKGDKIKCVVDADNTKDLLIFDEQGKVFKLPVSKISFTDPNSPGIDAVLLLKNMTSNIRCIMYAPLVESFIEHKSKFFLVIVSKKGMIKRIDLDDIITATPSGLIYSKILKGDIVKDVLIANYRSDIIVYSKSKALRLTMDSIPYLKRSTVGNKSINTTEDIDGLSVVTHDRTDVVVVTAKGKFNRIGITALPPSDKTNKAGAKVIKLVAGDYIVNIIACKANDLIKVERPDELFNVPVADIPMGSSVSQGAKMTKEGIISASLIVM